MINKQDRWKWTTASKDQP